VTVIERGDGDMFKSEVLQNMKSIDVKNMKSEVVSPEQIVLQENNLVKMETIMVKD